MNIGKHPIDKEKTITKNMMIEKLVIVVFEQCEVELMTDN